MPDVPLPPAGELVQITTVDGWSAVGCRTGDLPWVHAVGRPPVKCEDIASWCRVLVLPDTGELTDRIAAAHRDMPWDEWRASVARDPVQADYYRQLVRGYVAAVRGAAIR